MSEEEQDYDELFSDLDEDVLLEECFEDAQPSPTATQIRRPSSGGGNKGKNNNKKRGSYNCGKCGRPKKGHKCIDKPDGDDLNPCNIPQSNSNSHSEQIMTLSAERGRSLCSRSPQIGKVGHPFLVSSDSSNDRRGHGALACDANMDSVNSISFVDRIGSTKLPAVCMVEVLRQLPPSSLLAAGNVCRQWRQCALYVWAAVREIRLLVVDHPRVYIPRVVRKCPNLKHLTLDVRSEIDDALLSSIAASRPCLVSLEIHVSKGGVSKVTGDGLNHFVTECKFLNSLKLEGCNDIGSYKKVSTSLATLWLADCCSINSTLLKCPSLTELSLVFVPQDDGSTDLCAMIKNLGQSCPRLSKLHIASSRLNHFAVLALSSGNFRSLRMLSFTFASEITDKSVTAIASSCYNLELLDLSGSSITDRGLGIICNAFSRTLSKLLIALCPNISVAGLEMVATQLPLLQLLDCGMSIRGNYSNNGSKNENSIKVHEESFCQQGLQDQKLDCKKNGLSDKLVIRHLRLKKLSLWGCTGIHFLYLDCPELVDLNVNSCSNLDPEGVLLQCPTLKAVHAAYCNEALIHVIQSQDQVNCAFQREALHFSVKRLADGSKRVQAPCFGIIEPCEDRQVDQKDDSSQKHLRCIVHTN